MPDTELLFSVELPSIIDLINYERSVCVARSCCCSNKY